MNWDAIGALGEIVGAFAVLASLLYLALQVRAFTKSTRGESERELMSVWDDAIFRAFQDRETTSIRRRAVREGLDALDEDERQVFAALLGRIVNTHFMMWRMAERGLLEPDLLAGADMVIVRNLNNSAGRRWWSASHNYFQTDYISHINELIEDEGTQYDT